MHGSTTILINEMQSYQNARFKDAR
jgi:hypothetical protein